MKKIGKIIFVFVMFIFMAICQINGKVYALSDSIKKEINYQEGVPEEYDVEVDAGTMIESLKVPSITLSLENALYGEDDLLDIDFFDVHSNNKNDIWLKISDIVKKVYSGSLYIAAAIMLTLLIYMAVKVVGSSVLSEGDLGEKDTEKKHRIFRNPFRGLKDKRFVETWISSLLCLTLVIFVMNLIIALSDVLIDITSPNLEKNDGKITVYIREGEVANLSVIKDCSFDTNIEGFYAFQTQHNWEDYAVQNILYEIAAVVATWTKFVLYALFIGRMLLIAFIIAIAPILIVIDAIRRISGNKSFLKKWIILFIYLVFIRTVINILYYVLTKTNVYTVADHPLYIFFIIVIIHVFAVISLYKMFRYLIRKEPKKA